MSNIDVLVQLEEQGTLKPLVKAGLIPPSILLYMNIYLSVHRSTKNGIKKSQAVSDASEDFKVHPRTVWIALAKMK
jgi:hypothetical protein